MAASERARKIVFLCSLFGFGGWLIFFGLALLLGVPLMARANHSPSPTGCDDGLHAWADLKPLSLDHWDENNLTRSADSGYFEGSSQNLTMPANAPGVYANAGGTWVMRIGFAPTSDFQSSSCVGRYWINKFQQGNVTFSPTVIPPNSGPVSITVSANVCSNGSDCGNRKSATIGPFTPWVNGTPCTGRIILYADANFSGPCQGYNDSSHYVGATMNDQASSVIVNEGTWILYYDADYGGSHTQLAGPNKYGWLPAIGIANDAISSLKLVSLPPPPPPPPVSISLSANPTTIYAGQSAVISWTAGTTASTCSATSPADWTTSRATYGSQTVSPTATTTYGLTCQNAYTGVSANASTTVAVNPKPVLYRATGSYLSAPLSIPNSAQLTRFWPMSESLNGGTLTYQFASASDNYQRFYTSIADPALRNATAIKVKISFSANADRTATPSLSGFRIGYLSAQPTSPSPPPSTPTATSPTSSVAKTTAQPPSSTSASTSTSSSNPSATSTPTATSPTSSVAKTTAQPPSSTSASTSTSSSNPSATSTPTATGTVAPTTVPKTGTNALPTQTSPPSVVLQAIRAPTATVSGAGTASPSSSANPGGTVDRSVYAPGDMVTLALRGVAPKTAIDIYFNTAKLRSYAADRTNFNLNVTIPTTAADGPHRITLKSGSWNADLTFPITVRSKVATPMPAATASGAGTNLWQWIWVGAGGLLLLILILIWLRRRQTQPDKQLPPPGASSGTLESL